jgi:hypothetical protein
MTGPKQFAAACVILSLALASQISAKEVNTVTQSSIAKHTNSRNGHRSSTNDAGRKGISCQRDIPYKGDDGQMHLCK